MVLKIIFKWALDDGKGNQNVKILGARPGFDTGNTMGTRIIPQDQLLKKISVIASYSTNILCVLSFLFCCA